VDGTLEATLEARLLEVGNGLVMKSLRFQKRSDWLAPDVDLTGAKIARDINMIGASFDGKLVADSLRVDGSVTMGGASHFKEVDLMGAKVTGAIFMNGASFDGALHADYARVDGSLFIGRRPGSRPGKAASTGSSVSFKDVSLNYAKIAGTIDMTGAYFGGTLDAKSLQVGGDLSVNDVYCVNNTFMTFAHVGGNLDLRGATLPGLDLSGASVAAELRLGGSTVWTGQDGKPKTLNLSNAQIGNLQDATDAWPARKHLNLDGLSVGHFSGLFARKLDWWDDWARRDSDYSPGPYAQLVAALTRAGARDDANEILYLGRVRERETQNWLAWVWSGFLQYVVGFGIGIYTFWVLGWVIIISLFGALYLKTRVKGHGGHGFLWFFGASLDRLFPVIEINQEFTEFFNDPKHDRLTRAQNFFFFGLRIVGLALGAVLAAAVAGLIQGS
jgi:hypothetical protein